MAIKHVRAMTTSLNGCKVEIDGDVSYGLIPPRLIGFHGVVHLSGGSPGCPEGDLYFGLEPHGKAITMLPVGEGKP